MLATEWKIMAATKYVGWVEDYGSNEYVGYWVKDYGSNKICWLLSERLWQQRNMLATEWKIMAATKYVGWVKDYGSNEICWLLSERLW